MPDRAQTLYEPTVRRKSNLIWTSISISASGDNTIITPTAGYALRIVFLAFVCNGAVNVILYEGTSAEGQTAMTGVMNFTPYGGLVWDRDKNPIPLDLDSSFVMNLSAAIQVSGLLLSYEIPF